MRPKRELKFRVWDGSKMEYSVIVGALGVFYVQGMDENDSASLSPFNTKYPEDVPIMQFTGLKDVNGKEIYEGDVVCIDEDKNAWSVEFDSTEGKFSVYNQLNSTRYFDLDYSDYDGVPIVHVTSSMSFKPEIIGNIYVNPELLKTE